MKTLLKGTQLDVPLTDERLMEMIQVRIRNGLDLLYERYAGLLKSLSMRVLHNDADAQDVVQDVLLEIWERAASYDPMKGKPLSWIATLTRRRSIDRLRKRETHFRVEDRFARQAASQGEGWTHVQEDVEQIEMNQHLQRALASLPSAQRTAINFAYQKQMSQREIAALTGIPLGTIKTRLELGLKKMAASLCGLEDLVCSVNHAAAA
jgi:RNA polymerase sigma-70 factor (ECF subfamily)